MIKKKIAFITKLRRNVKTNDEYLVISFSNTLDIQYNQNEIQKRSNLHVNLINVYFSHILYIDAWPQ